MSIDAAIKAAEAAVAASKAKPAETPEVKATSSEPKVTPKFFKVRATQFRLHHPYLRVYIDTGESVPVGQIDSWLQCQLDAKLAVIEE